MAGLEVKLTLGRTTYVPGDTVRGTVQLTVGKDAVRVEAVSARGARALRARRAPARTGRERVFISPRSRARARADAAAAARPLAH
jgi:broad specificity phosphatase PhoE